MAGAKPNARKAEADAGPSSTKKVKTNAKQQAVSKTKKPAKAATEKANIPEQDNTPFAWKACAEDADPLKRLDIKEEAVRRGLRHANRIATILRSITEASSDSNKPSFSGALELQNWLKQLDELKKRNSEFQVFIGFAGVTGAGKTSAINSIIGFRDLLPSSNESAATAVPCLIAYNDDPDSTASFKAEISFRTENDIIGTLDHYFEAQRVLDELSGNIEPDQTMLHESASESPEKEARSQNADNLRDFDIVEEDNQELLEMVSAVFKLSEADLKSETTDSLLARNPDVQKLLGSTKTVCSGDAEQFSRDIKPYMDSVAAVHGDSGLEFEAWPLINEVKVFVRSDVLKNGVVLVDLPGLADNVESRAAVAQHYFGKLSLTAIVTPIVRARNEQTGVHLMTENQQYCMQMDGKFHKKSFCIILSKMDDINVETYLKQHNIEAQDIQSSRDLLKSLNQEFKETEREKFNQKQLMRALDQKLVKLKTEHKQAVAQGENEAATNKEKEIEACSKQRSAAVARGFTLDRRQQLNRKQSKHVEGRILHWCINGRNGLVKKEIQADFQRRQKRLTMGDRNLYDGTVNIFPISSSAFWKVTEDSEAPVGFPAVEYTGIPALNHWFRYAASPDREKHLDTVLNTLHGLFNTMQTWSSTEFQGQIHLTKQFVHDQVLYQPLHKLGQTLNTAFKKLSKDIRNLDPMKSKDSTVANCKEKCIGVVKGWAKKDPDNMLSKAKMHWNTYHACVTRNGGVFRSKTEGKRRYAWIESLCNLFYEGIVKDWNLALNEEIPALRQPANKKIDELWDVFMMQLEKRVRIAAPQMKQLFDREKDSLEQIKEELKDRVQEQFDHMSVGASKAHRTITKSVQGKFELAFKKAKKEKGKGRFLRQQQLLVHHAHLRGSNMFKESSDNIADRLKDQLKSTTKEFHSTTTMVLERVRDLVSMMLDDATQAGGDGETLDKVAPGSKQDAKEATRQIISEWAVRWRIGGVRGDWGTNTEATAIPDTYYDDVGDGEDSDADDIDDPGFEDFLKREAMGDDESD